MDYAEYFKGKKITVMRIGLLGRGVGDTAYMAEAGAEITVVDAAEQEAIKNGCIFSTLDTFDFQAEVFYKKCGYECMGEIKNYFFDHSRIFLRKKLKR